MPLKEKQPLPIHSSTPPDSPLWMRILLFLLPARGIVFNLLFIFYVANVQPVLLNRLLAARSSGAADWPLALGIVAVQVLDLVGYFLKGEVVYTRAQASGYTPSLGAGLVVGFNSMLRICMTAFLLMLAVYPAFGIDLHTDNVFTALVGLLFLFVFIAKDGLMLAPFFDRPPRIFRAICLDTPRTRLEEALGELFLMIFAMVTLTLTWDVLLLTTPPIAPGELVRGILGMILMFVFIYPPSRLVFVTEEWLLPQKPLDRFTSVATFGVTLYLVISQALG